MCGYATVRAGFTGWPKRRANGTLCPQEDGVVSGRAAAQNHPAPPPSWSHSAGLLLIGRFERPGTLWVSSKEGFLVLLVASFAGNQQHQKSMLPGPQAPQPPLASKLAVSWPGVNVCGTRIRLREDVKRDT